MSVSSEARIPDAPAIQRLPLLQLILVGLQLLIHRFMRSFWANISVLIGMDLGYILCGFIGMVDLSGIAMATLSALSLNLLFNILGGAEQAANNECHAHQH